MKVQQHWSGLDLFTASGKIVWMCVWEQWYPFTFLNLHFSFYHKTYVMYVRRKSEFQGISSHIMSHCGDDRRQRYFPPSKPAWSKAHFFLGEAMEPGLPRKIFKLFTKNLDKILMYHMTTSGILKRFFFLGEVGFGKIT